MSRVARGVHGHQAIGFPQLHISTVDSEVHHSRHKRHHFHSRLAGQGDVYTCAHTAPTQISIVCPSVLSAGACAHAHLNVRVHGLVYR